MIKSGKQERQIKKKMEITQIVAKEVSKAFKKKVEHKYFDTVATGTVGNTADIVDLSNIPQGDTDTSRDGDAIRIIHIEGRYTWFVDANSGGNSCRLILLRWRVEDNVDPVTASSVLQVFNDPLSAFNMDHLRMKKFQILYDKIHVVSDLAPAIQHGEVKLNLEWNVGYQNGTTVGTDKVYMFAISDAGSDEPVLRSYWRLNYYDA